jgi:hypothetical protein
MLKGLGWLGICSMRGMAIWPAWAKAKMPMLKKKSKSDVRNLMTLMLIYK